eukprot:439261_1
MGTFVTHPNKLEEIESDYLCPEKDIFNCRYLTRLQTNIQQYNESNDDELNKIDTLVLLNDFLHLMNIHDNDEQFGYIHDQMMRCDIKTCNKLKRNYRDRMKYHETTHQLRDLNNKMKMEIIDRIHCYYHHSYDLGNRLRKHDPNKYPNNVKPANVSWDEYFTNKSITELAKSLQAEQKSLKNINIARNGRLKKFHNLGQQITANKLDKKDKMFHCGYLFQYDPGGITNCFHFNKIKVRSGKMIKISPKYSSLKEEVTTNKFCVLTMEQFKMELKKAELHRNSYHCKSNFNHSFETKHILSLMLYCNFTQLQYIFSKTYRDDVKLGGGIISDLLISCHSLLEPFLKKKKKCHLLERKDHSEFYYWGMFLKDAVKQFGTRMCDGNLNALYHGIGEPLLVNIFIPQMKGMSIGCPLSTTSSFAVAVNFTNHNNGLILHFCDGASYKKKSPKYLSVSWLSDYPNEFEYLFNQIDVSSECLLIDNITNAMSGMQYKSIIHALYMRNSRINLCEYEETDDSERQIVESITDEIWRHDIDIISSERNSKYKMHAYVFLYVMKYSCFLCSIVAFWLLSIVCSYETIYLLRLTWWNNVIKLDGYTAYTVDMIANYITYNDGLENYVPYSASTLILYVFVTLLMCFGTLCCMVDDLPVYKHCIFNAMESLKFIDDIYAKQLIKVYLKHETVTAYKGISGKTIKVFYCIDFLIENIFRCWRFGRIYYCVRCIVIITLFCLCACIPLMLFMTWILVNGVSMLFTNDGLCDIDIVGLQPSDLTTDMESQIINCGHSITNSVTLLMVFLPCLVPFIVCICCSCFAYLPDSPFLIPICLLFAAVLYLYYMLFGFEKLFAVVVLYLSGVVVICLLFAVVVVVAVGSL